MFGKLFNQSKNNETQTDQAAPPPASSQAQNSNQQSVQQPPSDQNQPENPKQPDQNQNQSLNQPNSPQDSAQPGQTDSASQQHPGAGLPKGQQPEKQPANSPLKIDMSPLSHLDPRASLMLTHSQEETRRIHQQYIEPDQLLFGLLYDEQIGKLLGEFNVDVGRLSKEIQARERVGAYKGQPILSKVSQEVFEQAYRDAKMRGSAFISPEDILIVLFTPNYNTQTLLQAQGLKKDEVVDKLSKSTTGGFGRKSTLEKFAIDLTTEAREGKLDPVAGRDKEIDRIVHILLRRTKNNPIIIGETGVGKTAIVEGLAQKIVGNSVPKDLLNKRIFQLDVAGLVAGASHRGEFEERLKAVVAEVLGSNGSIILFIDEIHSLMGAGESEGMNAANIIKPYLARGQLQIIGATTTTEYRKHFEKDKAFERRFQPVTAEEPSDENAFEMMKVIRSKYEKFHRVKIPDDALKESIKLAKKYIGERFLPDKSIDLLDEGCSEVKLQVDSGKRGDAEVKKADIEKVVSAWTGIPITKLTEDESEKLLKLEERIHQRLIDQEEAVVAVSEAVRRGRIGLASGQRPTASFIFLGPTGVGKTELAKTLAELLFGRDDAMARLDMSEFMEKHEVAKLIGAPPGYVGYEEGGVLTEAVRKKPYSIVLFDEIEKAHPDVFNILLQLLEDGRLTDNKGNVISFKNTIVICTSNIGSGIIQQFLSKQGKDVKLTGEQMNKQFAELQKIVKDELIKFLRPEVLNRFDEVVIFKPLRPEHMAGIVRLGIAKTAGLLKEQGYGLQISEKAINKLAKDGYDPVYGARPLRRLIQTVIENPIALAIISKKFAPGDTIIIDYNDNINEFFFTKGGLAADSAELTDAQFKIVLQQIASPQEVKNENDKDIFTKLHDKVTTASSGLNPVYASILAVTVATAEPEISVIRKKLEEAKSQGDELAKEILDLAMGIVQQLKALETQKKILLYIVNPETVPSVIAREKFKELHDKLVIESQNNNPLASEILQLKVDSPQSLVEKIMNELNKGKDNENELATSILALVNSEITKEVELQSETRPATKFKKFMKQLGNPLYLAQPENKKKFSELHDKINEAGRQSHPLASSILSITDITSDSDIDQLQQQLEQAKQQGDPLAAEILSTIEEAIKQSEIMKIKGPLLLIANPITAQNAEEKEMYTNIHTKVDEASQKGNELASAILNVSDATTEQEINDLTAKLNTAKEKNDDIALLIFSLIDTGTQLNTQFQSPAVSPGAQDAAASQPVQPPSQAQQIDPAQNFPFGMSNQNQTIQNQNNPPQYNQPMPNGQNLPAYQPPAIPGNMYSQPPIQNMANQPGQVNYQPPQMQTPYQQNPATPQWPANNSSDGSAMQPDKNSQ
jgi:ATP-dependent Clp protease ATP-binding subunit ClpC